MGRSSSSAIDTLEQLAADTGIQQPIQASLVSTPEPLGDKGVTNDLSLLILKELGNPPSKDEEDKIRQVLTTLNSTKVGRELCKSFGSDGCTWDNLKSAKVEITTRDLKYHLPEPLESLLSLGFASNYRSDTKTKLR